MFYLASLCLAMGAGFCRFRRRGSVSSEPLLPVRSEGPEVVDPGTGLDAGWLQRFPLRTEGRNILDQQGDRFRLRGVNWYGASDKHNVVGGLDVQCLEVICESIAALGFTCVRLPFSNEMLRSSVAVGSIEFAKNPSLRGLTPLQVLDEVVHCLGRHSLAVILNNHTTYSEWCGGPDRNGMWFTPGTEYTEERWIEDWGMLAARYRRCLHVIGCDLRNEVRFCPWPFAWPGVGCSGLDRLLRGHDWITAAAACAERVVQNNSQVLIIVERIIWPMRGIHTYLEELLPRFEGRLVLGVHHYAWNGPGRYLAFGHTWNSPKKAIARGLLRGLNIFSPKNYGDMTRGELVTELYQQWGFALQGGKTYTGCPVWVSEFGSFETRTTYDGSWFERFVEILGTMDVDFAYWPLNVGFQPGLGREEHYGLLGADWRPKAPPGDGRINLMMRHGLLPDSAPS